MKEYLHRALTNALTSLHYPAIEAVFEKPKIAIHGDLTTNVAMLLAKSLGKNPRQVRGLGPPLQVDLTGPDRCRKDAA